MLWGFFCLRAGRWRTIISVSPAILQWGGSLHKQQQVSGTTWLSLSPCVCVCVSAYRRHTTEPLTERRALRERKRDASNHTWSDCTPGWEAAKQGLVKLKKRSKLLTKKRRLKRNRKYLVTVMHPFAMVMSLDREKKAEHCGYLPQIKIEQHGAGVWESKQALKHLGQISAIIRDVYK